MTRSTCTDRESFGIENIPDDVHHVVAEVEDDLSERYFVVLYVDRAWGGLSLRDVEEQDRKDDVIRLHRLPDHYVE